MSLTTGGRAIGATSTRSSSASAASRKASSMRTIPTCSPAGPTSRTSGTRIRSLIRGSVLISPPVVVCGTDAEPSEPAKRGPKMTTGPTLVRRPGNHGQRHASRFRRSTRQLVLSLVARVGESGLHLQIRPRHRIGRAPRYHPCPQQAPQQHPTLSPAGTP